MTNLHNEDGYLDMDRVTTELRGLPQQSNKETRREGYAAIQAAALVDIAESLRTLALESNFAMQRAGVLTLDLKAEPDVEDESEGERIDAIVNAPEGTRVRGLGRDDSVLPVLGTLTATHERGIDQGEPWVTVIWDDDAAEDGGRRVFASQLAIADTLADIRDSTVPLVGVATESEASALRTDEDEDGEPATGGYELDDAPREQSQYEKAMIERGEHVDDLDADFDGDRHPAAEDALAALKAREAARKRQAKKGKK